MDGKHVVMQACGQGSLFYNYKGGHSIVLMVLAGPSHEIIWYNVRVNGRVSDEEYGIELVSAMRWNPPLPEILPNRTEDDFIISLHGKI